MTICGGNIVYDDSREKVSGHRAENKQTEQTEETMIQKLISKIQKTGAPICGGAGSHAELYSGAYQKKAFGEFGETLEGAAEAVWQYNKAIVDAVYDLIPAVKPQIAMYEQFGVEGVKAFKKTVDYCKSKDLVVIGDVKRGDIGSTSAAYAVGHLGKVQVGSQTYAGFDEDFATVNPYLGSDGVKPFMEVCRQEKKGLFILVKTSNPSSGEFQDRLIDGRPLYELVGEQVAAGARSVWAIPTAMWALWWALPTRSRERCCERLCPRPTFWCPDTAPREAREKIWFTSSMRTAWEPS